MNKTASENPNTLVVFYEATASQPASMLLSHFHMRWVVLKYTHRTYDLPTCDYIIQIDEEKKQLYVKFRLIFDLPISEKFKFDFLHLTIKYLEISKEEKLSFKIKKKLINIYGLSPFTIISTIKTKNSLVILTRTHIKCHLIYSYLGLELKLK